MFGPGTSRNVINDFEGGPSGDRIDLSAIAGIDSYADLIGNHIRDGSDGITIENGSDLRILLTGVTLLQLSEDDFIV